MADSELIARVERVERQSLRLKWALAVLAALLLMVSSCRRSEPTASLAPEGHVAKVLRAEKLEIVNSSGDRVVQLSSGKGLNMGEDNGGVLLLHGKRAAIVMHTWNRSAVLSLTAQVDRPTPPAVTRSAVVRASSNEVVAILNHDDSATEFFASNDAGIRVKQGERTGTITATPLAASVKLKDFQAAATIGVHDQKPGATFLDRLGNPVASDRLLETE